MPIQLGLTLTEDGVDETIYFEQAAPEDATWSIKLAVNEPYSDGDEFQVWFGTLNRPAPADRIDVAVKLARSNHVSAPTLLADEAAHYAELQGLQDSGYIPVSYGHFTYHSGSWSQYQPGFLASVLVLEANTAWKPLIDTPGVTTNWAFLPFAVRRNILQAYVALHSHGFIHPYYNLSGEHVLKSDEPEDSPDDQSIRIISLHSTRHQDCPHRAITMEDLDIGGYMPNDGRLCEGMEKICLRLVIHRPRRMRPPIGWQNGPEDLPSTCAHDIESLIEAYQDPKPGFYLRALRAVERYADTYCPQRHQGIKETIDDWHSRGEPEGEKETRLRHILPKDFL